MKNRRNVLKSIGTAAAGALGLSFLGEKAKAATPKQEKKYIASFEYDEKIPSKVGLEDGVQRHGLADLWTADQIRDFVKKTERWSYLPNGLMETKDVERINDWLSGKNNHFVYVHWYYGREHREDKNRNTYKWARFIDPDRQQVCEVVCENNDFWVERREGM